MSENRQPITLDESLWVELLEVTGGAAAPCFQCGVCTAICPWGETHPGGFSVRGVLRAAQLGQLQELEPLWLCSGCLQCEASCPRGVEISAVMRGLRYVLWRRREHLHALPAVLWSCYWNNNPFGQPPSARMEWAAGLDIPAFDPGQHEWLLYVGCTSSYDRRAQATARAAVRVLRAAGAAFGVLGVSEPCCGESVLSLGHRPYFEELASRALQTFNERGVRRIVVLSPHPLQVFAHDYPALGGDFEVVHISQLVAELVDQGRLQLQAGAGSVAYHDPCLLGRGYGEYEAPRALLAAIPGLELVAMKPERAQALCCGGGGGRMYLETPPGERFGDLRVEQARQAGATILATACPLCISCLEDSMKILGQDALPVLDVIELVDRHLENA